jgi:hypothetical protein
VKGEARKGLTLKVLRKHIKRLVNYAGAGDRIREELKRIVPVGVDLCVRPSVWACLHRLLYPSPGNHAVSS